MFQPLVKPSQYLWLLLMSVFLSALGFSTSIAAKTLHHVLPPAQPVSAPVVQKPLTPDEELVNVRAELQKQASRLAQLEQANQQELTSNQALQLENDNLKVQVKVLQGERSAQLFLYGALTAALGALSGYMFSTHLHRKTRRW